MSNDFDPAHWLVLPSGTAVEWAAIERPCGAGHNAWHMVKYDPSLPRQYGVQCLACLPLRPQRRTRQGLTLQADVVVGRVDTQRRRIVYERGEGWQ